MNIFFVIIFLSSFSLFSSDIQNTEKTYAVSIQNSELDAVLLDKLLASKILKDVHAQTGRYTMLIFDQDIGEGILFFREKRTRELAFLEEEQRIIDSLVSQSYNPLHKADDQRAAILLEAQEHYLSMIPQRKNEEKLSFLEFLSLYSDDRAKLLEDIKTTNSRLS